MQATLESFFPGFGDLVLHREVVTPLDIERVVGLSEGNIFAGEFLAPQMFFFRPAPGWNQYRTPIEGYYQCGSGTHPGGCVMGAPGRLASQQILGRPRRQGLRVPEGLLPRILVVLGFVAHLGVGFVVMVSGLIMPLWAILALGVVWAVGLVVMIRNRMSPLIVIAVPVLTLGLWALTGWAGERYLDWTA